MNEHENALLTKLRADFVACDIENGRLAAELAEAKREAGTMGGDARIQTLLDEIQERAVHEKSLTAERDALRAALERYERAIKEAEAILRSNVCERI